MDAARMNARKGYLQAATLLESVLAMGLLAAVMSLAVLMHARTLASGRAYARMQAWSASEAALAAIAEGAPLDRTWEAPPGMTLTAEDAVIAPGVRTVHLTCTNGAGTVLDRRIILPAR